MAGGADGPCAPTYGVPRGARAPRRSAGRRPAERHRDRGRPRHPRHPLARPRGDRRGDHAVHDLLRAPRRAREADASEPECPEPRRVVDHVEGRPHVGVRAAEGHQVPQRRSGHRRGREVLLRALSRRGRAPPQGAGAGGPGGGPDPRPLSSERSVARLHDLLRHERLRRGLDRAEEVHREGRRGRLPEGPDRRGAIQVRELPARDRAHPRGFRGLLAQDPERQAPRDAQHPRGVHARRRAQAGRGGYRLLRERAHRRGRAADSGPDLDRDADERRPLPHVPRAVDGRLAMGRPARPHGRELGHRPPGDQRGGVARVLGAHRQHRAPPPGVRAPRPGRSLRSQARAGAADRGRLPQRVRRGRAHPVSAIQLDGRGHRELSRRGGHPHACANDGARGPALGVAGQEAQEPLRGRDRIRRQRLHASGGLRDPRASSLTAASRSWRPSSRRSCRRWTARSARRCSTRSSG